MTRPHFFDNWPPQLLVPWGPYRAATVEPTDPDTIPCWVSLGLDHYAWVDVRLGDVNAPELDSHVARERADAVAGKVYLASLVPYGAQVRLGTIKAPERQSVERRTFTRYVGWLERAHAAFPDGWMDVNATMRRWLEERGYEQPAPMASARAQALQIVGAWEGPEEPWVPVPKPPLGPMRPWAPTFSRGALVRVLSDPGPTFCVVAINEPLPGRYTYDVRRYPPAGVVYQGIGEEQLEAVPE